MLKTFVLITLILEFTAGLALLFAPEMVPDLGDASALSIGWARMYGAAALAMAYLAFQVWRNFESNDMVMVFLNTFVIFHTGVWVAGERAYSSEGFSSPAVFMIHLVMAILTFFFLYQKRKADSEPVNPS